MAKRLASMVLAVATLVVPMAAAPGAALAQTASTGALAGYVAGTDGAPIGGASVSLQGPVSRTATTDGAGHFAFAAVPPGAYTLILSKAGFATTQLEDVLLAAGSTITLHPTLAAASFSSLRTIGSVSTAGSGRATINTTPASVQVISQQTFANQNDTQVTQVLNQTPGIITNLAGNSGTSEGSEQVTQIRGALPYETESLIDGHPVSVGADGTFSPTLLNPALLQDVEVVKGPGASPTEINYAINGSVNYRTLEPTRTPQENVAYGVDGFGGQFSSFQATGSLPGHVVDYAFAAATNGTPSGLNDYRIAGSSLPFLYGAPPYTVNGQVLAGAPIGIGASNVPQFYGAPGEAQYQEPLYVCCQNASAGYHSDAELAKLRINFSQQTALTLSYLGGQSAFADPVQQESLLGIGGTNQSFSVFIPPAGYTGSVTPGTAIPFDTLYEVNEYENQQDGLLQAELRTTLGAQTGLLARFYAGSTNDYSYQAEGTGPSYTYTGNAWGGLPLCPRGTTLLASGDCGGAGLPTTAPVTTYFNGTPTVFSYTAVPLSLDQQDHLQGYSLELDRTVGADSISLSFDRSHHDSTEYEDEALADTVGYLLYPGSGQTFTTLALRNQLILGPQLSASLNDYWVQYASHYTDDGGTTWQNATHSVNAPRVSLAWRPSVDTAVRFSAGESIAPPYINILSSPAGVPQPNVTGAATEYLLNENNGDLAPETAFGYDLGLDQRVDRFSSISADVYLTSLHNLFLPTTFQDGTYTPSSGADAGNTEPLFVTQTSNLAQARYEGVELTIARTPPLGFGFRVQGSLERAFTYNLPPGFYDTALGPNTANLGVIPNVNFYGSGGFYDGTEGGRVPYAMGYAEANWRTTWVSYQLGVTYYGPNNAYALPPFGVVSASVRFALGKNTTLTISGDNLTGAYDAPFGYYMNGVPVPLANGQLGVATASNYGPTTVRVAVRHHFGS
jgi:outer membrane receptor protein involved in Fe transport